MLGSILVEIIKLLLSCDFFVQLLVEIVSLVERMYVCL